MLSVWRVGRVAVVLVLDAARVDPKLVCGFGVAGPNTLVPLGPIDPIDPIRGASERVVPSPTHAPRIAEPPIEDEDENDDEYQYDNAGRNTPNAHSALRMGANPIS